jgi:hypothetical protein
LAAIIQRIAFHLIITNWSYSVMQDVPQEAIETRAAAEAPPLPVKAPRKTVKQIREAKEEAARLNALALDLSQSNSGGGAAVFMTPEKTAQCHR